MREGFLIFITTFKLSSSFSIFTQLIVLNISNRGAKLLNRANIFVIECDCYIGI